MNRFLKNNSPWLGLLGLALIVVLLAYILRPKSPEYKTGVSQSLNLMVDHSGMVSIIDVAGKQLIDIRPANQFAQGHPVNAINIPLRQLLEKENIEVFKTLQKSGQETILYGNDELQATAPWLLLQQLGYKNVKLLKGGYALNNFTATSNASKEEPCFDKNALQVKPDLIKATENKSAQQGKEVVIPVRKAGSTGGGC